MSTRLTVIIPNWNTQRFLGTCLSSLRKQYFKDFEVILVDSGSTDNSVNFVKDNFPEVRTIALEKNLGFSGAVNTGIAASDTELVALLNNDTEQDPRWLDALVLAADLHSDIGFFASKLLDFHDRKKLDGAGDALRKSGLPYRLGHGERDRGQYEETTFVFGACAAAALYRREMLDDIGFFDDDFFAYCEDGDLSFRAQLAGYRCLYVPEAVVYHIGGASTGGKRNSTSTRLGTRNSLNLLVKNLPAELFLRHSPFFVLGQFSRLLITIPSGLWKAYAKGLLEALQLLPVMLRKRRDIQKRRRVSTDYVVTLLKNSSRAASSSLVRRLIDQVREKLDR